MLNEERIRLMTKMAVYEKEEGKDNIPLSKYSRKDYVGFQMIRAFFSSTVAFLILLLFCALGSLGIWTNKLSNSSLILLGLSLLLLYLLFVAFYQFWAYRVYKRRYKKAYRGNKQHYENIKAARDFYRQEEKEKAGEN